MKVSRILISLLSLGYSSLTLNAQITSTNEDENPVSILSTLLDVLEEITLGVSTIDAEGNNK